MILQAMDKHLTEQEFYTLIKFFDLFVEHKEFVGDQSAFTLRDISIGKEENGTLFNRISLSAQVLDISVDIEKGYDFDKQIKEAKLEAENKPEKEKNALLRILKKIEQGNKSIKFDDIGTVSWIWYEVYTHIKFTQSSNQAPEQIKDILRSEMNKYLDNFLNGQLAIVKKNYYKFEAQKQELISMIEKGRYISLYGNNFIIKEEVDKVCVYKKKPDFCLVQTLYGLQKLGYLKVVGIWEDIEFAEGYVGFTDKAIRHINTNIILNESFINEINDKYKKDNPTNIFEKFDAKKGLLKFAGKEIELSKKGKETDAVLLLKSLLIANGTDWKYNDEILNEWGYHDDELKDMPKNKVYFAGHKINNAVALITQIDDFIECNTTKARINPKYKIVDE